MFRADQAFHSLVHLTGVLIDAGLVVIRLELVWGVAAMTIIVHGNVDERVVNPVDVVLIKGD